MSRIFKNIKNLDIFDIYYFANNEEYNVYRNYPKHALPQKGVFVRVLFFLYKVFIEIKNNANVNLKDGTILFFASSINQYNALTGTFEKLNYDNKNFLSTYKSSDNRFPLIIPYFLSTILLPYIIYLLIVKYYKGSKLNKESFKYHLDHYILVFGFYLYFEHLIRNKKIKCVVLSNDHHYFNRTIMAACKHNKIMTFYLQHASVTKLFPPLDFNYAFLEGEDALIKYDPYRNINPTNMIFLVGNIKKYRNKKVERNNGKIRIGISLGLLDDIKKIVDLINQIENIENAIITIRAHPGDNRNWELILSKDNFLYSNSKLETSDEFLVNIDILIVGESNIALEASFYGIFLIYVRMGDYAFFDHYGFIKNRLIENVCLNPTQICEHIDKYINQKKSSSSPVKFFYNTYGTAYENMASEIISETIENILINSSIPRYFKLSDKYPNTYTIDNSF